MLNLQSLPTPKVAQTHRGIPVFQTRRTLTGLTLPTQDDLPSEDNVPMETEPHRLQMELLIDTLRPWLASHGGGYVSGNMFLYFSAAQLRGKDFLGPDVFVVLGASTHTRNSWVVWQEGKGPDLVIELLSEKTAKHDKGKKKQIYQDQLKVAEYFWFDPWNPSDWAGFELVGNQYRDLTTATQIGLPSQQLGLLLVRWQGVHKGNERIWLRWATLDGTVLPTSEELAEAERLARQQAEQRAAYAEAEVARLTALLAQKS